MERQHFRLQLVVSEIPCHRMHLSIINGVSFSTSQPDDHIRPAPAKSELLNISSNFGPHDKIKMRFLCLHGAGTSGEVRQPASPS